MNNRPERSLVSWDHVGKLSGNSRQPIKALYAGVFACLERGFFVLFCFVFGGGGGLHVRLKLHIFKNFYLSIADLQCMLVSIL